MTQETHDPIARVTAMLEQGKQTDGTQGYMDMLHGDYSWESQPEYICQAEQGQGWLQKENARICQDRSKI